MNDMERLRTRHDDHDMKGIRVRRDGYFISKAIVWAADFLVPPSTIN
jgi:hypothetical protein